MFLQKRALAPDLFGKDQARAEHPMASSQRLPADLQDVLAVVRLSGMKKGERRLVKASRVSGKRVCDRISDPPHRPAVKEISRPDLTRHV